MTEYITIPMSDHERLLQVARRWHGFIKRWAEDMSLNGMRLMLTVPEVHKFNEDAEVILGESCRAEANRQIGGEAISRDIASRPSAPHTKADSDGPSALSPDVSEFLGNMARLMSQLLDDSRQQLETIEMLNKTLDQKEADLENLNGKYLESLDYSLHGTSAIPNSVLLREAIDILERVFVGDEKSRATVRMSAPVGGDVCLFCRQRVYDSIWDKYQTAHADDCPVRSALRLIESGVPKS